MPTVALMTDAAVRRLKAPPGERVDYFDAAFPGHCLRITGAIDERPPRPARPARRVWCWFYRFGGKQKRLTLGTYPAMSLAESRAAVTQAQLQIRVGVDPAAVIQAGKERAARAPDTMANVVEQFIRLDLDRRKRAPRYIADTRRIFHNHVLPRWANRDIKSITRRDVIELLDAVVDAGTTVKGADGRRRKLPGGPIIANRTLAAVRALFNWALRRGMIESTPAAMVERPGEEVRRERTLTADEIRAVWSTASTMGYPFGVFFQLTLITGQRRDEVARMRWTDIDFSANLWTLDAEATKAGRTHVVPLAPLAIDILKTVPRIARITAGVTKHSPYVLTTAGDAPVSGFSKAKSRLDRAVASMRDEALAPWTIHDLRRTAATEMGRLGVSRFIISKVLNHVDRTVTGIYDRHAYAEEKRHALETWAQYLAGLTEPLGANVVTLRGVAAQ
jgi:integrase